MDKSRKIVAEILEGAAATAETVGAALPPELRLAVTIGAGVAKLAAGLVRSLGINQAHKVLEELKLRVDNGAGVISSDDLVQDAATINTLLDELFGPKAS